MSIIVVGVMAACLLGSSYLMYQSVYRTLDDANIVVVLNANADFDIINKDLYDDTKNILARKNTVANLPANLRDIFTYASSTPAATATSAKK